ncbi:hypothetical protein GCM10012285_24630 [Streptomyces kronopolitis]|uniref:Resolvase n=1 Tax=Streptomyces kronopolitis TaxID=1612435 RepID=A0ABQ2JDV2_9ACTN|nr:hypothetical protein GCM10012285_24630 [Streptomyces kronopolitis]
MIPERQREAISAAKQHGVSNGRKPALTAERAPATDRTLAPVASSAGISYETVQLLATTT